MYLANLCCSELHSMRLQLQKAVEDNMQPPPGMVVAFEEDKVLTKGLEVWVIRRNY